MVKIYALVSGQLILYVGKTKQALILRSTQHRCKKCNTTYSKFIPDYIDWTITLLEEVPDEQGAIKEQYYIDTLKPFYNIRMPGHSDIDYEKSIHRKESKKRYYLNKKARNITPV